MSNISLRAYTREIETLIDQGLHDQAIAHCKQVLSMHPKYLDAYRMLGKAYLESKRLGDAEDIFLRILSSIPDDFISHVGMSIIREDEGNLNEAIWHMERAFETQPSNNAIQNELKKLIARRDGVEPIKINLTRVALTRMYLKGGLYQQAINELRISLAEEPQRYDLQVLLARAYNQAGQKVEAAEACTSILGKLPYCLDANSILYEALLANQRIEESKAYLSRLSALNPYYSYVNASAPTPDLVPDEAVVMEKLVWKPDLAGEKESEQPGWANHSGVKIDKPDQLPEWLSTGISDQTQGDMETQPKKEESASIIKPEIDQALGATAEEISEPRPATNLEGSTENIPEWMKEAGWSAPSSEKIEQEKASEEVTEPEKLGLDNLAPAEIPEWLQSLAPAEPPKPEIPPATEEIPWLDETPPGESDSIATWLKDLENEEEEMEEPPTAAEGVPDWLLELSERAGVGEDLDPYKEPIVGEEQILVSPEATETSLSPDEELPEWLYGFEEAEALEELSNLPAELEKPTELTPASGESLVEAKKPGEEMLVASPTQAEALSAVQEESVEKTVLEEPIREQDTKPVHISTEAEKRTGEPGEQIEQAVIPAWLEELVKQDATEFSSEVEPIEELKETVEWSKVPIDEQETIELPEWLREEPPIAPEIAKMEPTPSIPDIEQTTEEIKESDEWLQEFIETKEQPAEISEWAPEEELPMKVDLEQPTLPLPEELKAVETITQEPLPEPELEQEPPSTEQEITEERVEVVVGIESGIEVEKISEILADVTIKTQIEELDDILYKAHQALAQEDSEGAVRQYEILIKAKKYLPEIIQDLNHNLQLHPMDVSLWTSLGDAHMRSGSLQNALNAYIKAEELLR